MIAVTTPMLRTPLLLYASSDDPNFGYLTGFAAPDPMFVLVLSDSERHIFTSDFEYPRAQKQSRCEPHRLSEPEYKDKKPKEVMQAILQKYGVSGTLFVTDGLPCSMLLELQRLEYTVEVLPNLLPARRTKRPDEIENLKKANEVSCECFRFIKQQLRDAQVDSQGRLMLNGEVLTCEWLRNQVELICIKNSAQAISTIIACGADGADPHNEGAGPVYANQFLVCDIFPRHKSGYFGDMTRTFMKGTPTEFQRGQYEAVKRVHDECIDMVRVGIPYKDVAEHCNRRLEEMGYPKKFVGDAFVGMIHGLGHGVGLDIHEKPGLNLRSDEAAEKFDCFTIEPGLYYPEHGGVRVEDSLYIDGDGSVHKLAEMDYECFIE